MQRPDQAADLIVGVAGLRKRFCDPFLKLGLEATPQAVNRCLDGPFRHRQARRRFGVATARPCTEETVAELVEHLLSQGVSKELLPERLEVLDELPRSSGGKVAKGQLRELIRQEVSS